MVVVSEKKGKIIIAIVVDLLNPDFFCEEKGIGDEDDQVSNMPPESLRLVPPFIANERHPLHYRKFQLKILW